MSAKTDLLRFIKLLFSSVTLHEPSYLDKLRVESVVITQTFGQPAAGTTHTKLGGGTGGGGSATGNY